MEIWYVDNSGCLCVFVYFILGVVFSFFFFNIYFIFVSKGPAEKKRRVSQNMHLDADIVKLQLLMTQRTKGIDVPIEMSPEMVQSHKDTLEVLNTISPPHLTEEGPLAIPIVTVETDNENLVFEREGCAECSKKGECVAHLVNGPPDLPLNEYTGPGAHGGMCILCIRMECAMLVQMHRMCGSKPVSALLPPFTNLVDCPGGYNRSAMAVTPADQSIIKGGVHIMGMPASLVKTFNPMTSKWFIDQGAAVYRDVNSGNG